MHIEFIFKHDNTHQKVHSLVMCMHVQEIYMVANECVLLYSGFYPCGYVFPFGTPRVHQ